MKKLLVLLLCMTTASITQAQHSTEVGYGMGFSGYLGDLQSRNYTYQAPGFTNGFLLRQNINPYFTVRGMLNIARIRGDDKFSYQQSHIKRNLSFRSDIIEIGVVGEYNILAYDNFNPNRNTNRRHFNFTPYLFGGINIFHFNPKTNYKGVWVELQPLSTEGQGTSLNPSAQYSLTQFAIPFGIGTKLQISEKVTFSFEFGFRKTFTDYLDDVSGQYVDRVELEKLKGKTSADLSFRGDEVSFNPILPNPGEIRGDPNDKDWYLINTLSVSYKIYNRLKMR